MGDNNNLNRLKRARRNLADHAEIEFLNKSQKMISILISDSMDWLMNEYKNFKKRYSQEPTRKELQQYTETNDEITQIGMEKKEIAVMWAMRKLGYPKEKIQEILDLANKAYLPIEKR